MDINAIGRKILDFLKKYRFVVLILTIGIVLMVLPTGKKEETEQPAFTQKATFEDPTRELAQILSQIQGAGKVQLLLTKGSGERTVYQTDEDRDTSDQNQSVRVETVIVTDKDRTQQGLIQQILAPEYRGAIVVCQGADNAAVRLAIIEAVSDATGLGTDRISVLKMK
jgi:stage III sporulation protein AG